MDDKSRCPRCSNTDFEAINEKPVNSDIELIFVRCTSCKTVVGVLDFYNIGTLIKKFATKLQVDLDK